MASDVETKVKMEEERAQKNEEVKETRALAERNMKWAEQHRDMALQAMSDIAAGKPVNVFDLYSKSAGRLPEPYTTREETPQTYITRAIKSAEQAIGREAATLNKLGRI